MSLCHRFKISLQPELKTLIGKTKYGYPKREKKSGLKRKLKVSTLDI